MRRVVKLTAGGVTRVVLLPVGGVVSPPSDPPVESPSGSGLFTATGLTEGPTGLYAAVSPHLTEAPTGSGLYSIGA